MRVGDTTEQALLKRIARLLGKPFKGVQVGVGDDAALLHRVGPKAVLTADLLVEDVDFSLAWAPWKAVGHKAAAVNLSDLAAMGAAPRGLLLSLGLRPKDGVADVMALIRAVNDVGRQLGAPLVGGDLSRTSGPLVVAVTAVGQVSRPLLRHRGRAGDVVMVSGTLGGAALGLACLQRGVRAAAFSRAQLLPTPRVALAMALGRAGVVRSAADISDGLLADAAHVAGPGRGVCLYAEHLPLARGGDRIAKKLGLEMTRLALSGGEDFELVLAVAPKDVKRAQAAAARVGIALTAVGEVTRAAGVKVVGARDVGHAYDHFAKQSDETIV